MISKKHKAAQKCKNKPARAIADKATRDPSKKWQPASKVLPRMAAKAAKSGKPVRHGKAGSVRFIETKPPSSPGKKKAAGRPRKTSKKKTVNKKRAAKKSAAPKKSYPIAVIIPLHPLKIDNRSWNVPKCMEYVNDKIATSSNSLGRIIVAGAKEYKSFPGYSTIMQWLSDADRLLRAGNKDDKQVEFAVELLESYARARESQAEFLADELLEIADDGANDWIEKVAPKSGLITRVVDHEHVQRSTLRIKTRQWLAEHLKPKKFGQVSRHEHTGADGSPIVVTNEFVVQPVKVIGSDK